MVVFARIFKSGQLLCQAYITKLRNQNDRLLQNRKTLMGMTAYFRENCVVKKPIQELPTCVALSHNGLSLLLVLCGGAGAE